MPWYGPTCSDVLLLSPGGDRLKLSPGSSSFLKLRKPCGCSLCAGCPNETNIPTTTTAHIGSQTWTDGQTAAATSTCSTPCVDLGGDYILTRFRYFSNLCEWFYQEKVFCTATEINFLGNRVRWDYEFSMTLLALSPLLQLSILFDDVPDLGFSKVIVYEKTITDCFGVHTLTKSSESSTSHAKLPCQSSAGPTWTWPTTLDVTI